MAAANQAGRERRTETRHHVDVPVDLRAYRVPPLAARMIDVSEGGALVALTSDAVERGDELTLFVRGLEVVTTVAWATEEFLGLSFHRRMHASELAAIRKLGRQRGHA